MSTLGAFKTPNFTVPPREKESTELQYPVRNGHVGGHGHVVLGVASHYVKNAADERSWFSLRQ